MRTVEQKERAKAAKRLKYHTDPEYRARVQQMHRDWYAVHGKRRNATKKQKYETDAAYRAKVQATARQWKSEYRIAKYGITRDDYQAMHEAQRGLCLICGRPPVRGPLHIDHCHQTGKVRGLLCRKCNTGLGCYEDDIEKMKLAIAYLERHRGD